MNETPFSTPPLSFSVGAHLRRADRIVPVFLPFAGCPRRCVFCAQDRQTGVLSVGSGPAPALEKAGVDLTALVQRKASAELAFYGGTFTSLPDSLLAACLDFYRRRHTENAAVCGRCSTRPDAVTPSVLERLRLAGLDLVELGVQSFDDTALCLAGRGYNGGTALDGCRAVLRAGLSLGIQLMPGMPGVSPHVFLDDVDRALQLRPACLRFYPCLVPDGTELAEWWRQGRYTPWTLEETVETLGEGLRRAWQARVPVLRLAVAPEATFDATLLAGPRHPALGALIQAQALLKTVDALLPNGLPSGLSLPRSCQGFLYGEHGVLRPQWSARGLPPERITFHADPAGEGLLFLEGRSPSKPPRKGIQSP